MAVSLESARHSYDGNHVIFCREIRVDYSCLLERKVPQFLLPPLNVQRGEWRSADMPHLLKEALMGTIVCAPLGRGVIVLQEST